MPVIPPDCILNHNHLYSNEEEKKWLDDASIKPARCILINILPPDSPPGTKAVVTIAHQLEEFQSGAATLHKRKPIYYTGEGDHKVWHWIVAETRHKTEHVDGKTIKTKPTFTCKCEKVLNSIDAGSDYLDFVKCENGEDGCDEYAGILFPISAIKSHNRVCENGDKKKQLESQDIHRDQGREHQRNKNWERRDSAWNRASRRTCQEHRVGQEDLRQTKEQARNGRDLPTGRVSSLSHHSPHIQALSFGSSFSSQDTDIRVKGRQARNKRKS